MGMQSLGVPLSTGGGDIPTEWIDATAHERSAVNTGTSRPVTITGHASTHTEGAWVELIASTDADFTWVNFTYGLHVSTQIAALVDIGIGAAASETPIVSDLAVSTKGSTNSEPYACSFPFAIPAGSRISARMRSSASAATQDVAIRLSNGIIPYDVCPNVSETFGAITATSLLTAIDPGGVAHTLGSYIQLAAATTIDAMWALVQVNGNIILRSANVQSLLNVATGAAAAEVPFIEAFPLMTNSAIDDTAPHFISTPVDIASGARISAASRANETTVTVRNVGVGIILFGRS
jgi:hypothetical protein